MKLKKLFNKLGLAFSLGIIPLAAISCQSKAASQSQNNPEVASVVSEVAPLVYNIYEGDAFDGPDGEKFIISGIDTPDIIDETTKEPTTGLRQKYALEARNFLRKLLADANNNLIINRIKKDKFGRSVVELIDAVSKKNIAYELVKEGLAIVRYISDNPKNEYYYEGNKNYYDTLIEFEELAGRTSVGIKKHNRGDLAKIYPTFNWNRYFSNLSYKIYLEQQKNKEKQEQADQ